MVAWRGDQAQGPLQDPNLIAGHLADVDRVLRDVLGVGRRNQPAHFT
jgi:hypothetical protein